MKNINLKRICVLLCTAMLLSVCSPLALAAEAGEKVLMDLDFEDYPSGRAPTDDKAFDGTNSAVTDAARMYVETDGDNQVLKCYHGYPDKEGENKRGPRLEKTFMTKGLTNLTISYDVKSSGGNSSMSVLFMQADSNTVLGAAGAPYDFTEWTNIQIQISIKKGNFQVYVNGKKYGDVQYLSFEGLDKFTLRLYATVDIDGSYVLADNFKVTTTDMAYENIDPSKIVPYNAEDELPETGDILTVLSEDFEGFDTGKAPTLGLPGGFNAGAINETARMYVEKDTDTNKMLKIYHGAPDAPGATSRSPRVDRTIPLTGLKTLTIDMDMKNSGGNTKFPAVYLVHETENSPLYVSFLPTAQTTDWVHVKIRCDLKKGVGKVYVDGRLHSERKIDLQGATACRMRITCAVQLDGSWSAIDNVVVTTPDTDIEGLVAIDGANINWDKLVITDENKTGMGDVILSTHPRLYTNDWQTLVDRAQTDENVRAWYNTILTHANAMLTRAPVEYSRNVRGNINDCATEFKESVIPLAAAYGLTGDVRYKDRVYQELESVGNWPDWGADEWLCTAHINFAFAVCYDWLYNDFTAGQRANIIGWLEQHGLREAVLAYENYGVSTFWITGSNNWNAVCNGSNIALALAVYNERPNVADYILRKAAESLPYGYQEISEDGAYAEPLGYWGYAFRHIVKAMSALDTSLQPGKALPALLDFSNIPGLANTCDFPIYYNGTTAAFNYGDSEDNIEESPLMYYLAQKFNKPQYSWYLLNLREVNPNVSSMTAKEATFSMLWYNPDCVAAGELPLDKFYSSKEQYGANGISMRSSFADNGALVAMMHAGDQTAAHSSLDAGGFVLDWAGKRWVYMHGRSPVPNIPGTTYSWPGFHTKRESGGHYDYYHCRAEANNTIIANPEPNKPDMYYEYYADVERFESGTNTAYGIVNMTDTNKDYTDAKRGMMLTGNRDIVIIQDEITASKPSEFYWFVNTNAEITLAPDGKSALWEYDGDRMLVRITQGPADAKFDIMPTAPLPTSPDPEIQPDIPGHKLFIHMTNKQTLNLTVEFVPLKTGEGIPVPQPVKALADWSVDAGAEKRTSRMLGDVIALKVDNPNAFARGAKRYVDTANLDIQPIVQNGRTLVPVRFISENIGANVGWIETTQTVTIATKAKQITLQLGSNQMLVDGTAVTLDVPAQEIGGRTLIPLRALVEALGKEVFWDDRGLILITDAPVTYDAETIDKIIDLLDVRVQADGKEIQFFDSEVHQYNIEIAKGAEVPTLSVLSDKEATVTQGNPATVAVGGKIYTFNFVENAFEGILGTGSEGVTKTLQLKVKNAGDLPPYQTYLDIASATSSIAWSDKYPMCGTYDGIISEDTQNRWSANGFGSFVTYDLGSVKNLHAVAIAGYKALSRSYKFDIEVSTDGVNFTKVCAAAETTLGADRNVFKLGDVSARFVRITGVSATNTTWIGIAEIRFYDSAHMETDDQTAWDSYFYTSSINAIAGSQLQLEIAGVSKSGQAVPIAIADVKLTSENPEIATVSPDGVVTLVKAGSTDIIAETTVLGLKIKTSLPVTVE